MFEWFLGSDLKQFLCESEGKKKEVEGRGWELRLGDDEPHSAGSYEHVNRLSFSLWLRACRLFRARQ